MFFLVYRRSSFRSRDSFSDFWTSFSPSFSSCQPYLNTLEKLLKTNYKIYDVIECLNWNLKPHITCVLRSKEGLIQEPFLLCLDEDLHEECKLDYFYFNISEIHLFISAATNHVTW